MINTIIKKFINFTSHQYSLFSLKNVKKGSNCRIGKSCEFICPENITFGKNVTVANFVKIDASKGKVFIGDHTRLEDYSQIKAHNGLVEIGNYCTLNPFSIIDGGGKALSLKMV